MPYEGPVVHDHVNPVLFEVHTVKTCLRFHPKKNQAGTCDADRQTKNVQEAVCFVFAKISEECDESIAHNGKVAGKGMGLFVKDKSIVAMLHRKRHCTDRDDEPQACSSRGINSTRSFPSPAPAQI